MNKKDRRHSGRNKGKLLIPSKIAIKECLEPEEFWDDWKDKRDGMRNKKLIEDKKKDKLKEKRK